MEPEGPEGNLKGRENDMKNVIASCIVTGDLFVRIRETLGR